MKLKTTNGSTPVCSARKAKGQTNCFFLFFVLFMLFTGTAVPAQDQTAEVDKLFSWANSETPGCVCAVSKNGQVVVNRAYGMADLERNVSLTTQSVFDAASLQKQFVAAATLLLAEEKKLSLTDDIRKYVPELPDYGKKITIDHLLTHTSGIRDWTGLLQLSGNSADALTLILRQHGLNFAPGEEWAYSNSGYVLLKEIIGRVSGMPFSQFAGQRLFQPLGMKATVYKNDLREVVKNRALAYEKQGDHWRLDMKLDDDRGGGGALLSTASDLLTWNEALSSGRLGRFVTEKLQEPATLNNGRKLGYARGLFLDNSPGEKVIWHTGGSAGYGSILARFPDQGLSFAIMCNSGDAGDRSAASRRLESLFSSQPAATGTPNKAPAATDSAVARQYLSGKGGLFFNERTGEAVRLGVNNGRLMIAGGPGLVPVAKDHFRAQNGALAFMSDDVFELHFVSADRVEIKSMEGEVTPLRRAKAYNPSPEDLNNFSGRFSSNELRSVIEIKPGKEGLVLQLNDSPEKTLTMKAVDTDTFQAGRMLIRFQRDPSGKITGFRYSNPVLRNVLYKRSGEPSAS